MPQHRSGPIGAYRLQLSGVADASAALNDVPPSWLEVAVERRTSSLAPEEPPRVGDRRAVVRLSAGTGSLHLDRDAGVARYVTTTPLSPTGLVHPFLSPVAAIWAWWEGWPAFHAGAFVAAGGAWAVLGERGSGKSSTLGQLAADGVGVVADDLLVLSGGRVAAGPRCLDLRPDAARHLGIGESVGVLGTRERWRAPLADVPHELPFCGFIYLEWGEEVAVREVRGASRVTRLLAHLALRLPPARQAAYLELATLPAWTFSRPPGLSSLDSVAEVIEAVERAG